MSTHISHPVGASNSNPSTATPAPAGQEVTSPGTTIPVPADGGTPDTRLMSDMALVAAAKAFRESLGNLRTAFDRHMRTMAAGDPRRHGALHARRIAVIPQLIDLQRQYPSLSTVDPDVILAHYTGGQGVGLAVKDLQAIVSEAEDTERLEMHDAWAGAGLIYASACRRAKTDVAFAVKLAPVRDALKVGAKTDTSQHTTVNTTIAVTKAQTKAARAQQRALAAHQAQTRAAVAHATAHPTVGAPAPANGNQGPAVSTPADASVYQGPAPNPQGPAPGR